MNPENAALAARIKAAIERSGITKAELARRVGKTPQAVNGWLTTGTISKPLLSQVSQVLDEDLDYLLTGVSMPPPPRQPKRATGRGHGETYKALVAEESQPIAYQENQLLNAYRKMGPEARGALLAIAMLLAGCATPQTWHWERKGAGPNEAFAEEHQCRAQALSATANTGGLVGVVTADQIRESCMFGKGWYKAAGVP